ncbi:hypothetical protein GW17_00062056 [Ensete ventricosum]|nr:hypothetical protein GW17_00062056 [Ensete ventricosum]
MRSHTNMVSRKNAMVINFREVASIVEFRSVFRAPSRKFKILAKSNVLAHVASRVKFRLVFHAPSRKFKILANPNVLAHESSFDQFFMHSLGYSKYWPLLTY